MVAATDRRWVKELSRGHTFNGRVVLVDEVALDELDGQAGFTDTTSSNYHQLVLS